MLREWMSPTLGWEWISRNKCPGNKSPRNKRPPTQKVNKGKSQARQKTSFSECVFIANRLFWLWRTQQAASLLLLLMTVTTKEFRIRILQSIIYQYYKLKLQCTVYSAALHGCTALHCFLSFQVSLQCDSHFSHDWAPQESLKSSSGDSLGSHRYKRPAKARRLAIWLAYIEAAVGSGPAEHLGTVGIYPKGPSLYYISKGTG